MGHSSLRYRNATARQEWIVSALQTKGFLSIAEISREFGVSHMTVRRDLHHLEQEGQVRTVYGGVALSLDVLRDSDQLRNHNGAAEALIGRCAAKLVGDHDAIAIDAGRVGYEIARALPEQFRGTVFTHSIPVIQLLASRRRPLRIVGLGGEVMADRCAFVGASTVAAIASLRVHTLFLMADAVDGRGAYAHTDAEVLVKRALVSIADQTIVLADHRRFADSAPLLLTALRQVAVIVTDRPPTGTMQHALRQAGAHLLVAQSGPGPASTDNRRIEPASLSE